MQGEIERALGVLLRCSDDPPRLTVAGRTDAGVHALAQVASYDHEAVDPRALNAILPDDVAVLACEPAAVGFDARRDATSRAYLYRVLARRERSVFLAGRALHHPRPLELAALRECAVALVGTHDFTAFTPADTYHVRFDRDVYFADWRVGGELLEFRIEADAFMRGMVRALVGTMLEVGGGRRSVPEFTALLAGGAARSDAGPTAPAHGLYLTGVGYGGERVLG